jgi:HSP20 family protein
MLVKWNPYRNLVSLPNELDRFFDDFNFGLNHTDSLWQPRVDLTETENNYELVAEIPGLSKEDINLSLEKNVLKISGEKKSETEANEKDYRRIERAYGRFERSFTLPENVKGELIKASYKDGLLRVEIPKSEKVVPKQIAIN